MRIDRIRNLPVGIAMRMQLVDRACLSLLDFVNPSAPSSVRHLATPIKMALEQRFAAPEVLLFCFTKMPLDPTSRWILAAAHLLWEVCNIPGAFDLVLSGRGIKNGRLSTAKRELEKRHILVEPRAFVCGEKRIPVGWGWEFVRKGILEHVALEAMSRLSARRPNTFGVGGKVHRVQHMTMLQALPNFEASLMMKVWTGSLLTREKAYRVGRGEHMLCTCGMEQTVWQVFWECQNPDLPLVPPGIGADCAFPPLFVSSAFSCLTLPPPEHIERWKMACARVRHLMSLVSAKQTSHAVPKTKQKDTKGHMVVTDSTGRYSYCCRCFISRRIRDRAWIVLGQGCFRALVGKRFPTPFKVGQKWAFVNVRKWVHCG